jgi:hypothetical protein
MKVNCYYGKTVLNIDVTGCYKIKWLLKKSLITMEVTATESK